MIHFGGIAMIASGVAVGAFLGWRGLIGYLVGSLVVLARCALYERDMERRERAIDHAIANELRMIAIDLPPTSRRRRSLMEIADEMDMPL